MTSSSFPTDLVPVRGYDWPRAPATSSLKDGYRRMWEKLRVLDERKAELLPDDLERVSGSVVPDELWAALRVHQFDRLDSVYLDWTRRTDGPHSVCAFVTMPSVPQGFLADWAADRGLDLVDAAAVPAGKGALIVPDISSLVRRTLEGRAAMRSYLAELDGASRNVLLGVSSWTWTYLAQTSAIEAVVSDARCFAPFKDKALAELIRAYMGDEVFKSTESGDEILPEGGDGEIKDPYLKTLAARAYGCPWAAIRLLDAAVNREAEAGGEGGEDDRNPGNTTTWLQDPALPQLPARIERIGHFMLHALLIHGPLVAKDLATVLPMTLPVGLAAALGRLGLVDDDAGKLSIRQAAYPHVRRIVSEAGLPLDQI
ncbi:hypothetical protein SAMN05444851_2351 [Aliiroseovarius sediminilitoris]|uniref:Uncharacterized protein n=1 Tax=Aliiroseovarius sediminilitoris TaxID=1173584 RepID=A0A1I0Q9V6_9RHOB|nr:hypothetical protein [Aliiroseovarius sediminilitoris]SEW23578.1 hypothetical protein SAMN05444851_2351 [Aliiroseovarius sediminilitoris]